MSSIPGTGKKERKKKKIKKEREREKLSQEEAVCLVSLVDTLSGGLNTNSGDPRSLRSYPGL